MCILLPMRYTVNRCGESGPSAAAVPMEISGGWETAEAGKIVMFQDNGSGHKPDVDFRVLYNSGFLFVRFDVRDRYVRSVQTKPQSMVCLDSCAEFFVEPPGGIGYFNFEVNAGGTPHVSRIEIPVRTPTGFEKWEFVAPEWIEKLNISRTMPRVVDPEIAEPTAWTVSYRIPFALFTAYGASEVPHSGSVWRANFYKCGDNTSHPHWGYWNDIGAKLDFHQPARFGELAFC